MQPLGYRSVNTVAAGAVPFLCSHKPPAIVARLRRPIRPRCCGALRGMSPATQLPAKALRSSRVVERQERAAAHHTRSRLGLRSLLRATSLRMSDVARPVLPIISQALGREHATPAAIPHASVRRALDPPTAPRALPMHGEQPREQHVAADRRATVSAIGVARKQHVHCSARSAALSRKGDDQTTGLHH